MIGTQIEFKNLSKTFPSRKKGAENVVALSDINLTVAPGEIIGIIGYSGAGKSTLVRMINGLDTPTSGEVLLDGTNIVGMKEKELRAVRRNIGMIFQQFNLMNSRTAAGNIDYPLKLAGIPKDERDERVAELLDFEASPIAAVTTLNSFPAAKNSASASPAHSPATPPSCLPTKPHLPSTQKPRMKSSTSCGKSTRT